MSKQDNRWVNTLYHTSRVVYVCVQESRSTDRAHYARCLSARARGGGPARGERLPGSRPGSVSHRRPPETREWTQCHTATDTDLQSERTRHLYQVRTLLNPRCKKKTKKLQTLEVSTRIMMPATLRSVALVDAVVSSYVRRNSGVWRGLWITTSRSRQGEVWLLAGRMAVV